eukprot:Nitzschia sp. Nitz4//scaffold46_size129759//110082//110893//NITZ4_003521-RA/size129759-augustus-gene-0.26-mRNA-1//-1//CDS//3329552655//8324//frame0
MFRGNGTRTRGRFIGVRRRNGAKQVTASKPPSPALESITESNNDSVNSPPRPSAVSPPSTDGFSQLELQELQEAFELFDRDGTGEVTVGPLRRVLESLEQGTAEGRYPYLERLLVPLSELADEETLDFDAFLTLMASTSIQQGYGREEGASPFQHVFDLFDLDGKGYIAVEDLERVALELGEQDMTREELEEMIERAHTSQSGQVTMEEFSKLMTLNLFRPAEVPQGEGM